MARKSKPKKSDTSLDLDLSGLPSASYKAQIVYRPISACLEYGGNPREHPEKQVVDLAHSIHRFGFYAPIILDEGGEVIAGHGRLAAARLLKLDEVPTVTIPGLSEDEKIALRIADNKLAENSRWSMDDLVSEMGKLRQKDFDVSFTGFDPDEIAKILKPNEDFKKFAVDPDDAPEIEEDPRSAPGDVWILGAHRVMCGSSERTG